MILTVDIGNTTVALALVDKRKVVVQKKIDTLLSQRQMIVSFERTLHQFCPKSKMPKQAVICSVVPKLTVLVERMIQKTLGIDVTVIGQDVVVPLKNRYKNPKQVGQDRLVGAYAAMRLYAKPVIVIDLGTAITFDVVSKKGEYMGGAIVPGLRLSAESLFLKTALLPKIHLAAPKSVVGRTTQESMLSGLFYGYGSMCRGFIELIAKELGYSPKVVMTGGHTQLMKKFISPDIRITDENLVHKGMALLVEN